MLTEGLADIQRRGKAQIGDKTMVDALTPALEAYRASTNGDLAAAMRAAVEQAHKSAEATIPLQARKGRAKLSGRTERWPPGPGRNGRAGSCCRLSSRQPKLALRSGDAYMVGLVLVSHSKKLAQAVRELVLQMTAPGFPVAVAGRRGRHARRVGKPTRFHISEVLQKLNCPEGVLVLMDLGSAVLSAETALELFDHASCPIRLCPAPLVEGAIAAAVRAQAGGTLEEVAQEAETGSCPQATATAG